MDVRIDVRKLQLLNDRVNQCIDALNDVRSSVRGMGTQGAMFNNGGFQHSNPFLGNVPYGTPGFGTQGYTTPGYSTGGYPMQGGFYGTGGGIGLSHSDPRFDTRFVDPRLTHPAFQGSFGTNPTMTTGYGYGVSQHLGWGGGLSHTDIIDRQNAEIRANDPVRIAQTFPFVWVG